MSWLVSLCARLSSLLLLILTLSVYAEEEWDIEELISQEITVDLREPTFTEGILSTDQGGVIQTEELRIQARNVTYTRKTEDDRAITTVMAEGDLMVEYGCNIFVGDSFFYDFESRSGVVYNGRTSVNPWFLGGSVIRLEADGTFVVEDAYITTSESIDTEWKIFAEEAKVCDHHLLNAKNVKFQFFKVPLFWLPKFRLNLRSPFDSPIRYTFRTGGEKGPRIGAIYEVYSSDNWRTFMRVDYRWLRGWGGGMETQYSSPDNLENFHSINYYAKDISLSDPSKRDRYRFQGIYSRQTINGKTRWHVTYDKLSDRDMATDYDDRGLELDHAMRTEFALRHQERNWIGNFLTRLRINDFQTIKQELPTFEWNMRPLSIGNTGAVIDGYYKLSYLDFEYTDFDQNVEDYNSTRVEFASNLYRHFCFGPINLTPELGGEAIFYGNNPGESSQWLTFGTLQVTMNTDIWKCYSEYKHVIEPYAEYKYVMYPSLSPEQHHIFDIEDGWYRLNQLTVGARNHLLVKDCDHCFYRKVYLDLFTHAFFDTKTIPELIPKLYGKLTYNATKRLRYTLESAYDYNFGILDHFNARWDWTVSRDMAIAAEYRHRSKYDWRKVDKQNFILDSFRTIDNLLDSQVSDRRDTMLLRYFYRFHPEWALEFQSRHGWNRSDEPVYYEYMVNLLADLRSAWHMRFGYKHRENEDRFTFNIGIGIDKPVQSCLYPVPCLEF